MSIGATQSQGASNSAGVLVGAATRRFHIIAVILAFGLFSRPGATATAAGDGDSPKIPRETSTPDQSDQSTNSTILEQFKQFIADPPPIEELRFSFVGPDIRLIDQKTRKATLKPAREELIIGCWSREATLVYRVPKEKIASAEPFSLETPIGWPWNLVHAGNVICHINAARRTVTEWTDVSLTPFDNTNPVLLTYRSLTVPLFSVLNGGLHYLEPGALSWNGNRFSVRSRLMREGLVIDGQLFADEKGLPARLEARYRSTLGEGHYVIRYRYSSDPNIPAFLPKSILATVSKHSGDRPDKKIVLEAVKLGNDRMFDLQEYRNALSQQGFRREELNRGRVYSVDLAGNRTMLLRQAHTSPILSLAFAPRAFYGASGGLSLGFIALAFRALKKQKKQE